MYLVARGVAHRILYIAGLQAHQVRCVVMCCELVDRYLFTKGCIQVQERLYFSYMLLSTAETETFASFAFLLPQLNSYGTVSNGNMAGP